MQTLPQDVTQVGRGKAQRAILTYLHALPAGHHLFIEDLARAPQLRRVHFANIERAVGGAGQAGASVRGARAWLQCSGVVGSSHPHKVRTFFSNFLSFLLALTTVSGYK